MRTTAVRLGAAALLLALAPAALAQTPQGTSFTYQGRLTETGALASGPYDFQFVLYDAPVDGTQVGPTVALEDVTVGAGLFTVNLDFGSVFGSEKRWLELGVRPGADTGPYTPILPRQELTPGPAAIFSAAAADAQGLGGVPADQFVQTDDPRLSDARDPLPGSPDYVQNGTVAQPGVSFNVGGTGTADILDAATQYNLGGARILANPGTGSLFAGVDAGASNTGNFNSFVGFRAGALNDAGAFNTFFGAEAGAANVTGNEHTYIGRNAGVSSTGGIGNTFVGRNAGANNMVGSFNTTLGWFANVANLGLSNATAIGAGALVSTSNTMVLGNSVVTVQVPGSQTVGGSLAVNGSFQAATVGAATQYNLGGQRVLGTFGTSNLYVGPGTGSASLGTSNTFVGSNAGRDNTNGSNNTFFGTEAGQVNTTGQNNSFFGSLTGRFNTAGNNSFFGVFAGAFNTIGDNNSFFGSGAGNVNTTGAQNVFIGQSAGSTNATGNENTFVGTNADWDIAANPVGNGNTLLGANARVPSGVSNATAMGNRAEARQSNSLVLGSVLGSNGATSNTNVGIGTVFPNARLHIVDGGHILFGSSSGCAGLTGLAFGSSISAGCQNYAMFGGDGNTYINRPNNGSIVFRAANLTQMTLGPTGILNLPFLSSGGATALCRNASNDVSTCSSSLRYKADVAPFRAGLQLVERLRPIRFTWTASGQPDIGLAAEEVAEVDPLLAFRNAQGEIEGVNYPQLTVVLVNALQQQQAQIEALKALVCQASPQAEPCLK